MKGSGGHAVLMAKHPLLRRIYYGVLGATMTLAGWGIAYEYYKEASKAHTHLSPLFFIGLALPFIMVGGEVYRYRDGSKKIRGVRCRDCQKESSLKAIYKKGRCPECNSKKLVGVRLDGSTM